MTDESGGADGGPPADVVGEVLGGGRDQDGNPMATGAHGVVTGDEDLAFDLEDCEIVAQSYDTQSAAGSRLYRVEDERFALAHFRRSAAGDWTESLVSHGRLGFEPVELAVEPLQNAIDEQNAETLSPSQRRHVQETYATACERALWAGIESSDPDDGPVIRGSIACVERPTWRKTIRSELGDHLTDEQIAGVLDGLMAARPDVDWAWCQLYAVYVAALVFDSGTTHTED